MKAETVKVILIGTDEELLWLRKEVLRRAGFDVVTTLDEDEALASIRSLQPDPGHQLTTAQEQSL